jgi:hypothetical protein
MLTLAESRADETTPHGGGRLGDADSFMHALHFGQKTGGPGKPFRPPGPPEPDALYRAARNMQRPEVAVKIVPCYIFRPTLKPCSCGLKK